MGTKRELLDWARKQVGTKGGSKYWYDVYGWSGNGWPWCAVFDSDALKQTGTKCAFFPSTVAFDRSNRAAIGSAWVEPYSLVEGDMVAFDWDKDGSGDHVGIVESVISYGYYRTVEGNVSDTCGYRYRRVSDGIIGGIRPNYSDAKEDEVYSFQTVKYGTTGNAAKLCQAALNIRNGAGLLVDGESYSLTVAAIKAFQKSKGLYVDGECGPITWGKLLGK